MSPWRPARAGQEAAQAPRLTRRRPSPRPSPTPQRDDSWQDRGLVTPAVRGVNDANVAEGRIFDRNAGGDDRGLVLGCAGFLGSMANLFFRSLSQGLQAFMPVAAALVWTAAVGAARPRSAIRCGLLLSIPATVPLAWWFQRSAARALDEAILATVAFAIALVC